MEQMKEKLRLTLNHEYSFINKIGDLVCLMDDNELDGLFEALDLITKEELFDFIKVYHKEVKRLKLDIKEIVENE